LKVALDIISQPILGILSQYKYMPTSKLPVHNVWVFFFILEIKDGLHSRTKFQDRAIWDNVKIIFNGKLFEILFKKSLNHMTANKNEMFL